MVSDVRDMSRTHGISRDRPEIVARPIDVRFEFFNSLSRRLNSFFLVFNPDSSHDSHECILSVEIERAIIQRIYLRSLNRNESSASPAAPIF